MEEQGFYLGEPKAVGVFVRRVNRFLCEVEVSGSKAFAHVHDPGRLEDLLIPGVKVFLREGHGKYPFYLYAVEACDGIVLLDSALHSPIVEWLIRSNFIFKGYRIIKKEANFGRSRIDFMLEKNGIKALLEVKGCSLLKGDTALFPDAPTERGRRHVEELIAALRNGFEAHILFLVVRPGARKFRPNWETDPRFSEALRKAFEEGVKVHAFKIKIEKWYVKPVGFIPVFI